MDKEKLLTAVAAILTTALETEPEPFPESMAYLAMGADHSAYETVKQLIVGSGLATTPGHSIKLTDKGRLVALDCIKIKNKL